MSEPYSIRLDAEKHWGYTEGVIRRALEIYCKEPSQMDYILELCHYLYVEAIVHGWKHAEERLIVVDVRR